MIIGISGKIGSGKDLVGQMVQYIGQVEGGGTAYLFEETVMDNIVDTNGWTWQGKKFADALKDNVCNLLGCTRKQLEDRDYKEKELGEEWWYYQHADGIKPYGFWTGMDKSIAERFLVKPTPRLILQRLGTEGVRDVIHPNAWVNAAMAGYSEDKNVVFTDMRFPNELNAVASRGGITIRVVRGDGDTGDHPSEVALDDYFDSFDYILWNNGSVEDLWWGVFNIMKDFNLIKQDNYENSIGY